MRIDELKRIAKENDYEYEDKMYHKFTNKNNGNYVTINSMRENRIWVSITSWCEDKDFNMIKAAIEFAETPIEDREEEKKYYLKHRWIIDKSFYMYLQKPSCYDDKMRLAFFDFSGNNDKKFTLKEIEEIKKKFDTDLKDFELVEVEE